MYSYMIDIHFELDLLQKLFVPFFCSKFVPQRNIREFSISSYIKIKKQKKIKVLFNISNNNRLDMIK